MGNSSRRSVTRCPAPAARGAGSGSGTSGHGRAEPLRRQRAGGGRRPALRRLVRTVTELALGNRYVLLDALRRRHPGQSARREYAAFPCCCPPTGSRWKRRMCWCCSRPGRTCDGGTRQCCGCMMRRRLCRLLLPPVLEGQMPPGLCRPSAAGRTGGERRPAAGADHRGHGGG